MLPLLGEPLRCFALFYLIVVVFSAISEVTYRGRTVRDVRDEFKSLLVRALVLTVVTLMTFFVYRRLDVPGGVVTRSP
jgi:hypothetical protein